MTVITRRRFSQLALGASLAACATPAVQSDILIRGGPIYTGLDGLGQPALVEAVRIRGGRIVFAGAESDARGAGARVIDLAGAAAYPGFVDSHMHLMGVGFSSLQLDLTGTPSIAALLEALRAHAAAHPNGPIVGRGWIETHWPERRFPNRADLDAVVSDRPVFLGRSDGHAAVANSAALALAGIDASTPDPDGGRIERDASGAATGMLIDNAMPLVESRLPQPDEAMRREALRLGLRTYATRGWAGLADMGVSPADIALYMQTADEGAFPIGANLYLNAADAAFIFERGAHQHGAGRIHVRGVKLYADGALGSRGAALLAPYADAPDSNGLLVTPPEQLRALMAQAKAARVQVATHAIGDRANRLVLDAYRDLFAGDLDALRASRWRIEHAQVIEPSDIPRFGQMGVIASMQPSHAISDLYFAPSRLGPDRLAGAYAWRSLITSGATIAAGSDAPVEKGDPLIEFYAAAYRHDLSGAAGEDWNLREAVSRQQALAMLTRNAAYATHQEAERGTIEVGKRADISAFSIDIMQAPIEAVPNAQAVLTMSDGEIAHSAL
ncbi:MAG: amidohydrolase [Hyphomonadaceae bacterium]